MWSGKVQIVAVFIVNNSKSGNLITTNHQVTFTDEPGWQHCCHYAPLTPTPSTKLVHLVQQRIDRPHI